MIKYLMLFIVLGMMSCVDEERPVDPYVSEEIPLRQLVNNETSNPTASGNFFLVFGTYSKEENISNTVKAIGLVNGAYRLITFRLEEARIVIDDTVTEPYIVIKSNFYTSDTHINKILGNINELPEYYLDKQAFYIHCSEELLPKRLLPITIN